MKFKLSWRIWILIVVLILSLFAIFPVPGFTGAAISSVATNSPAGAAGIEGPTPAQQPVLRERVISFAGQDVNNVNDFQSILATIQPNSTVQIRTETISRVLPLPSTSTESYILFVPPVNESFNPDDPIGLRVVPVAGSNVRKGLDLTGGARVLLTPEVDVDDATMELVLTNIQQRLNIFGLSDVIARLTKDFEGRNYILVEIAGANEQEIVDLLSSQGKFEAKIGNSTVFTGGDDVTHVGRSAVDSGIQSCNQVEGGYACSFYFSISLSGEAAQRQADITQTLTIIPGSQAGSSYLSEPLDLFLDGANISSLQIASSLQGRAETQIQITGSEAGPTQESAATAAQAEMKRLQTVLTTGSLPVKLRIVKTDAISPALGSSFINNIWLIALVAIVAVVLVVAGRYRDWRISIPMFVTMISELIIILGIAALIGWNLDLAAIAGIIIAIGTGVDDQIIMVDEIKSGAGGGTWVDRMKKAFFIIFAAFFTLVAAMLPLMWAGAGLVRGFALTTILGVTIGVLVTRPAFAAIAEKVIKEKN